MISIIVLWIFSVIFLLSFIGIGLVFFFYPLLLWVMFKSPFLVTGGKAEEENE